MLSDAHNPVSLSLNFQHNNHHENETIKIPTTKLWDTNDLNSSKETFSSNINYQQINEILNNLNNLENKGSSCTQNEIDETVNKFSNIFKEAATKSFGIKTQNISTKYDDKPPSWFGFKCKKRKKEISSSKIFIQIK